MILIAATALEATSETFHITKHPSDKSGPDVYRRLPVESTFQVIGLLAAAEYIQLQYYDGTAWRNANNDEDDGKILDANYALRTVYAPIYNARLYKPATPGNAVGVEVY